MTEEEAFLKTLNYTGSEDQSFLYKVLV